MAQSPGISVQPTISSAIAISRSVVTAATARLASLPVRWGTAHPSSVPSIRSGGDRPAQDRQDCVIWLIEQGKVEWLSAQVIRRQPRGPEDLDAVALGVVQIQTQAHAVVEREVHTHAARTRHRVPLLERGEALHLPCGMLALRASH